MKLMIVDDSTAMLKIVRIILKGLGYTDIVEAKDGIEAWEQLQEGGIDLLITDWNMPNMSGLELVEKVRANPATADLPIIMSTSRNVKEDIIAAMKAGVNNYVSKPYTPPQLKAKIEKVFKKRKAEAQTPQLGPLINNSAKVTLQDDFPFVAIVEKTVDPGNLKRPENEEIVQYLDTTVKILNQINQQFPDVQVRYVLEESTHAVMRLIRFHPNDLKLLLISNDIVSGGLTLARLAALNQEASYKVCLICEILPEFSAIQRDGMQKMGILLLERHRIDAEILEDLFKEHAVATTRETPSTVEIKPEELEQRLVTDISLTTELPVLPQVYNRIMKLARDPVSGMAEWTEAVETDPLSSAMILRRARSPVYGFRDKIEDVNRAVTLIGKDAVKDLVASASLKSALKSISDTKFKIEDFWSHSAAVGLAARMLVLPLDGADWNNDQKRFHDEWQPDVPVVGMLKELDLARRFGPTEDEDPFVGGMMHDIGKVAMTCAYPGLWSLILEGISEAENKIPMRDAEELVTAAADHTHVGAVLAKNWELGPQLTRAVECHHRPPSEDTYARLISLADFIGGAIHPFPRDAVFPHVLQVQRLAEAVEPVVALEDDEREALENNFLPPNLLETLDLDMDAVLILAALLAPGIQQLTDGIRRSLGTDD